MRLWKKLAVKKLKKCCHLRKGLVINIRWLSTNFVAFHVNFCNFGFVELGSNRLQCKEAINSSTQYICGQFSYFFIKLNTSIK